jgi:hypothetical protein
MMPPGYGPPPGYGAPQYGPPQFYAQQAGYAAPPGFDGAAQFAGGMPPTMTQYPGAQVQYQAPMPPPPYAGANPYTGGPTIGDGSLVRGPNLPRQVTRRWSVGLDFLALTEGGTPTGPVLVQDAGTGVPIFTSAGLISTWGMGPKVTLAYAANEVRSFEIAYWGIYDWQRNYGAIGNGNLQLAGPIALATFDFFAADVMNFTYRTDINSVEVNMLQMGISPYSKWLFGFRYIDWREKLVLHSTDFTTNTTSDFSVKTGNALFGAQTGWNGAHDWGAAGVSTVKLRGGIFDNSQSQSTLLNDFGNTFQLRNTTAKTNGPSTLAEFGLMHTINAGTRLEIRAGYNLIWIWGLARAPSNVDLSDTAQSSTTVQNKGDVFLHGFQLGSTFRW